MMGICGRSDDRRRGTVVESRGGIGIMSDGSSGAGVGVEEGRGDGA